MLKSIKDYLQDAFALRMGRLSDYLLALFGTALIALGPIWVRATFDNGNDSEQHTMPESMQAMYETITGPHTFDFYMLLLSVCIIAPLMEELFFRGVFWKLLERFSNETYAFFLTSILFAFAHVDPEHIVGVFPIGLYIGWLRLRSNSIFPSILSHITNNTIVCLMLLSL